MSEPITEHEQYVIDTAERALLSSAEAYRLVEEAVQLRRELAASEAALAVLVAHVIKRDALMPGRSLCVICSYHWWDNEEVQRHAPWCPALAAQPAAPAPGEDAS